MSFLQMRDGTGRLLRKVQEEALEWLDSVWDQGRHIVICAPVATGKSLLARTIQRKIGAPILTPFNALVKQYMQSYPGLNMYIGKDHYKCKDMPGKCSVNLKIAQITGGSSCKKCPLVESRLRAAQDSASIFNIASYYHFQKDLGGPHDVVIVDEAHKVLPMMRSYTHATLKRVRLVALCRAAQCPDLIERFDKDDLSNEFVFASFVKDLIAMLELVAGLNIFRLSTEARNKLAKWREVQENFFDAPNYYAVNHIKKELDVSPVKLARKLTRKVLGKRSILFSATLTKPDIEELLGGEAYDYLEVESPIPAERRSVQYAPCRKAFENRLEIDTTALANHVKRVQAKIDGNTFIHATYALAKQLSPHFDDAITHDKDTKQAQLNKYLKDGGTFIGSGCEEGLDLAGDLCRANIITKIQYPHMGDSFVRKRMSLPDGQRWYQAQALQHLIQACGRSTRTETDYSVSVVCDPLLPKLIGECRRFGLLPKWFEETLPKSWDLNSRFIRETAS